MFISLRHVQQRAALVLVLATAACFSGTESIDHPKGDGGVVEVDPRCEALCDDSDAECSADATACGQVCQSRIAGLSSLCASCLLESANGGVCDSGSLCCPDPEFPSSVLDCSGVCAGELGTHFAGTHPVCADLCDDEEPVCAEDSEQCLQECQARIAGVSGLCATCLLEGANGGACAGGTTCCPDPEFPTPAAACASVCGT